MRYQETDYDSPCRLCGRLFNEHTSYYSSCPASPWLEKYEASLDKEGKIYTTFCRMPICPHCGVEYQYNDLDDLHDAYMVVTCGRWDDEEDSNPEKRGCGKQYRVEPDCTRKWTTEPV